MEDQGLLRDVWTSTTYLDGDLGALRRFVTQRLHQRLLGEAGVGLMDHLQTTNTGHTSEEQPQLWEAPEAER